MRKEEFTIVSTNLYWHRQKVAETFNIDVDLISISQNENQLIITCPEGIERESLESILLMTPEQTAEEEAEKNNLSQFAEMLIKLKNDPEFSQIIKDLFKD
jgi:hypothetical protein